MKNALPKLPKLLERKIYKTGQTRGADDDVIYQNRVSRTSTVLIPYSVYEQAKKPPEGEDKFENGFIVLLSPKEYFETPDIENALKENGLELGQNALVFYETRAHWDTYNPQKKKWKAANNRIAPLNGKYVARVPATTALDGGAKITEGFCDTSNKGAGIRVYEYASNNTIQLCRLQLEAVVWHCTDAVEIMIANGMTKEDALQRKLEIEKHCAQADLLDYNKLAKARILNAHKKAICPLCLDELSAQGFLSKMEQAEGRDVPDITVTQLNLFHIEELRAGKYNHKPYNIGWGHHHCNVVVKDSGIIETLEWMKAVVEKNGIYASTASAKSGS